MATIFLESLIYSFLFVLSIYYYFNTREAFRKKVLNTKSIQNVVTNWLAVNYLLPRSEVQLGQRVALTDIEEKQ